jgi:DNA-binding CsgD family transcriptional regulator
MLALHTVSTVQRRTMMTPDPQADPSASAARIAESYLAALSAAGNPLVHDEADREARRASAFRLSLEVIAELTEPAPTSVVVAVPPTDAQPRGGSVLPDFPALLKALPEFVDHAVPVIADAVGAPSEVVTRSVLRKVTLLLADAYPRTQSLQAIHVGEVAVVGERACEHKLTRQEQRVLLRVAQLSTTQDIAAGLHVSGSTVKKHIAHIGQKLGAAGRNSILRVAWQVGVLTLLPAAAATSAAIEILN